MKYILIVFIFALWSVSSSRIRKIKKVEGEIKSIDFNTDYSNSYIVSFYNQSEWFYKLDIEQNILLTKNFYEVSNVLINSKNDVYVFSYDQPENPYVGVWFLENNLKNFILLSYFHKPTSAEINAFVDKDDNIFFNTNYGTSMLKSRQNIALAIGNLDSKYFSRYLVDDSGDVFFKTYDESGNSWTNILECEVKNQSVPNVKDSENFKIEETGSSQFGENTQIYHGRFGTYIYTSSRPAQNDYYNRNNRISKGFIKKLKVLLQDLLLSEYGAIYKILHETDNRLFVISEKSDNYYNIYYITKNDDIVAVNGVFSDPQINSSLCSSDKDGNTYLAYQKSIILLKENQKNSINIDIPSHTDISYIMVDDSNNLWVLAGDLFIIKNKTESATWLYTLPSGNNPLMKVNKLTNEIFVGSQNGLFVCSNYD